MKLYSDVVRVLGLLVEVHNVKSHWSELLQAARSHAVNNAQAEIALSVRDLEDVYQEYQTKFKEFSDSNLAMRNCLYSIQMNIVSDLDEWHDMISGSAFTTAPGCEAILEPAVDPPEYGQVLTGVLEQIRYQSITQRQQGDPRRHSTPQNSRAVSYTHLTLPTICSV